MSSGLFSVVMLLSVALGLFGIVAVVLLALRGATRVLSLLTRLIERTEHPIMIVRTEAEPEPVRPEPPATTRLAEILRARTEVRRTLRQSVSRDLLFDSQRMLDDLNEMLRDARGLPSTSTPTVESKKPEPKPSPPPEPEPGPRKIVL